MNNDITPYGGECAIWLKKVAMYNIPRMDKLMEENIDKFN
jgi:hypothetical protein